MLGVSGAKSFSGFMVAARARLPEPRGSSARGSRGRAGTRGVCDSALPSVPAHGPLRPNPSLAGPRAPSEPGREPRLRPPAPSQPAAHGSSACRAPGAAAMFPGSGDLRQLPPSAAGPAPHRPHPRWAGPAPARQHSPPPLWPAGPDSVGRV